jgi:hypothetical protein
MHTPSFGRGLKAPILRFKIISLTFLRLRAASISTAFSRKMVGDKDRTPGALETSINTYSCGQLKVFLIDSV